MISTGDMTYPLIGGRITGLRWLRIMVTTQSNPAIYPCRCTAALTGTVLTIVFAETNTYAVDLAGGPGIKTSSSEGITITAEVDTAAPVFVGESPAEVEPCCIFWLMTPLATALATATEPLPIVPSGDWEWEEGAETPTLTAASPEADTAVAPRSAAGVYMVNGISSAALEIEGSDSVVVRGIGATLTIEKVTKDG